MSSESLLSSDSGGEDSRQVCSESPEQHSDGAFSSPTDAEYPKSLLSSRILSGLSPEAIESIIANSLFVRPSDNDDGEEIFRVFGRLRFSLLQQRAALLQSEFSAPRVDSFGPWGDRLLSPLFRLSKRIRHMVHLGISGCEFAVL